MTIQRGAPCRTVLKSKQAHCTAHHSHYWPYSPVPKVTSNPGSSAIRSPDKANKKATAAAAATRRHHSQAVLRRKRNRPSMPHGRPGSARLITKRAMRRLIQSLNNNGAIPVGDDGFNAASAGISSPDLDPSNVHNEEADLGNVAKVSLQPKDDKVCMLTVPATLTSNQPEPLWTATQNSEPKGFCTEMCKPPTKRPLSPSSVHLQHSATPKRRQLPAIYTKLTVAGPPAPLQPQELAHFSAGNQCSSSSPSSSYTFTALPGAADMLPGTITPAQLLAVSPHHDAPGLITTGQQCCSVTFSPADHVAITILTNYAVPLKGSPAGQEVVKLALVLDGETVRAVITPIVHLAQPLRKQALATCDLSDPDALAFSASVKMFGSMAFVHLELLDDMLNGPASATHAASSIMDSTAIHSHSAGPALLPPPSTLASGSAFAVGVNDNFAVSSGSSSTNSPNAASDQEALGLPRSVPHPGTLNYTRGGRICRGCNSSSTGDSASTLCAAGEMVGPTAHVHLELQGDGELVLTQGPNSSSSPVNAGRPTTLKLQASPRTSLFDANSGSSNSSCGLSYAPVADALQESATPAALQSRAPAKRSAPSSWLARAVHGVVSSLFAPCLGMKPTAADGEVCNAANNRRRSLHGMRSTSRGRDGDVWVSVVKAGSKSGSGVGKLVRKLSSMRSRKDVAVAVDSQ